MVADIPGKVRILSTTLVIRHLVEDVEQLRHHFRFCYSHTFHSIALELVVQPNFHLPFFVDANLVLIDTEISNDRGQLFETVNAVVVKMDDVRVGYVLDIRQSEWHPFHEKFF